MAVVFTQGLGFNGFALNVQGEWIGNSMARAGPKLRAPRLTPTQMTKLFEWLDSSQTLTDSNPRRIRPIFASPLPSPLYDFFGYSFPGIMTDKIILNGAREGFDTPTKHISVAAAGVAVNGITYTMGTPTEQDKYIPLLTDAQFEKLCSYLNNDTKWVGKRHDITGGILPSRGPGGSGGGGWWGHYSQSRPDDYNSPASSFSDWWGENERGSSRAQSQYSVLPFREVRNAVGFRWAPLDLVELAGHDLPSRYSITYANIWVRTPYEYLHGSKSVTLHLARTEEELETGYYGSSGIDAPYTQSSPYLSPYVIERRPFNFGNNDYIFTPEDMVYGVFTTDEWAGHPAGTVVECDYYVQDSKAWEDGFYTDCWSAQANSSCVTEDTGGGCIAGCVAGGISIEAR